MAITAAQVKELRERTGIGMMECKKALEVSNGDMELAIEELRKKGLAKATKKADRDTAEGWIMIESTWDKAYVVSVACETDFLAISDKFKGMLTTIIAYLKENWADSKEAAQTMINTDFALELGENLKLREYKVVEGAKVWAYVHSNAKVAAVVVGNSSDLEEEKLKQVAMHVTASSPEYLSPDDISEEVVEKEKSIQLEIMKNDPKMGNKSDDILLKIIWGKIGKFKNEISLLEQAFVINPDQKVKDFIGADALASFEKITV